MNRFSEFDIKPKAKGFIGEKIDMDRILNQLILLQEYRIEPSKKKDAYPYCLYMQILYKGEQRVVFIGSKTLIQMIEQVPKDKFPFETTIVCVNKTLMFT